MLYIYTQITYHIRWLDRIRHRPVGKTLGYHSSEDSPPSSRWAPLAVASVWKHTCFNNYISYLFSTVTMYPGVRCLSFMSCSNHVEHLVLHSELKKTVSLQWMHVLHQCLTCFTVIQQHPTLPWTWAITLGCLASCEHCRLWMALSAWKHIWDNSWQFKFQNRSCTTSQPRKKAAVPPPADVPWKGRVRVGRMCPGSCHEAKLLVDTEEVVLHHARTWSSHTPIIANHQCSLPRVPTFQRGWRCWHLFSDDTMVSLDFIRLLQKEQ